MESTKQANNEVFKISENWESQSNALKQRFSILTDADLKLEEGKELELVAKIATKLGKTNEEVKELIKNPATASKI